MPATKTTRHAALQRQIARLDRRLADLAQHSNRLSAIRLALAVGGGVAVWIALYTLPPIVGATLLMLLIAAFIVVVRLHRRVEASRHRHRVLQQIKAAHIARLTLDWDNIPRSSKTTAPPGHAFASDLNLAGPRSLHHLLDTASTREGSQRLLDWLLDPVPDPATIEWRQAILHELIPMTRFRDRLTLAAAGTDSSDRSTALSDTSLNAMPLRAAALSGTWSGDKLLSNLRDHEEPAGLRPVLRVLILLAVATGVLFGLFALGILPPLWIGTFLLYGALTIMRRDLVGDLFSEALEISDGLRRMGAVLGFLESYPYGSHEQLTTLCAPLLDPSERISAYLSRVSWIAAAASLQANIFLWLPVNALIPWDMFFADRLQRHRADLLERLPVWLDVWAELEALNSLATFATLNPEYTFPMITADGAEPVFAGAQIGHPLIAADAKVCNDFQVDQAGRVFIITGSNMSGKSSFLRTIGLNLVLAYCGSVVNATDLRIGLFRLFSCIQVSDSVIDGISYFYAEVKRLRALLDALDGEAEEQGTGVPLFFLIDEIFRGTNNRERLIGSRAYLQALLVRGGTGLVATHDLELVNLADEADGVQNFHFRETVTDGQMHFDYTLRPGPCPTTNALVIMELAGLPVEAPL